MGPPLHGYAIGRWIREQTDGVLQVKEGALYPALCTAWRRRVGSSERWGTTDTGREAKYYTLTTEGRGKLKSEISRWKEYTTAVSAALSASLAEDPAG